jgi:uncharacterized SAM-binding protein YcdF (DUF218 family)
MVETVSSVQTGQRSLRYKSAIVITSAFFAFAVAWLARTPILQGVAEAWVVHDALKPADAIVVLGGGLETRPFGAAELYKNGLAIKILIANVKLGRAQARGILASHFEQNRTILLKLGVPAEAIIGFGSDVTNTYEEALALSEWASSNGAKRLIVPTELFSARRVRWILDRELRRAGAHVEIQVLSTLEYGIDDWWRHEAGVIAFQNEVMKYIYYRVKY